MDVFIQCSFAAGHSAQNMVEHAWALMSRFLVGVTLPIHPPGEDKAPCEQKGLSPEELRAKEVQVFDKAIDELNDYSTGRKYDGFDIHPVAVK